MLKRPLVILITLVYLSGLFSQFYIYAGYMINKQFIALNICVNRNTPAMHCDGKCYLDMELAKSSKQESGNDQNVPASNQQQVIAPHQIAQFKTPDYFPSAMIIIHSELLMPACEIFAPSISAPPEFTA